jgi:hypothetical protein
MGFLIVYKKLIFKGIKIVFRIRCIMSIVEKLIEIFNYLIRTILPDSKSNF